MGRRRFDEVAENVVVPDLQRRHIRQPHIVSLHRRDDAPAFVPQLARLVEVRVIAGRDEAAIPDEKRWLCHQRRIQHANQFVEPHEFLCRVAQKIGQIRVAQLRGYRACLLQAIAHGGQITRATAVEPKSGQCTVYVRNRPQARAQVLTKVGVVEQCADGVQAAPNHPDPRGRTGNAPFQQPPATGSQCPVDAVEKRPLPPSLGPARQLEASPGRGVDLHRFRPGFTFGPAQQGQAPLLGCIEVVHKCAHRRQLGARESPEGVKRCDGEQPLQFFGCSRTVEGHGGKARRGAAKISHCFGQNRRRCVRNQHLARGQPRKLGSDGDGRQRHHPEVAGRYVDPGQRRFAPYVRKRGEVVVAPCLEKAVFGQRAGRHQPHDAPPHDRLGPALLRLGRVLELLADRDPEALADQRQQVAFRGVDRHAAHRDILAQMLAAFRQRNVERCRRRDRIIEEQLVEVAHAVEQQRVRMLALDVEVLRHHRRHHGAFVGVSGQGVPRMSGIPCLQSPSLRRKAKPPVAGPTGAP